MERARTLSAVRLGFFPGISSGLSWRPTTPTTIASIAIRLAALSLITTEPFLQGKCGLPDFYRGPVRRPRDVWRSLCSIPSRMPGNTTQRVPNVRSRALDRVVWLGKLSIRPPHIHVANSSLCMQRGAYSRTHDKSSRVCQRLERSRQSPRCARENRAGSDCRHVREQQFY
jgi:hypothetical protein